MALSVDHNLSGCWYSKNHMITLIILVEGMHKIAYTNISYSLRSELIYGTSIQCKMDIVLRLRQLIQIEGSTKVEVGHTL